MQRLSGSVSAVAYRSRARWCSSRPWSCSDRAARTTRTFCAHAHAEMNLRCVAAGSPPSAWAGSSGVPRPPRRMLPRTRGTPSRRRRASRCSEAWAAASRRCGACAVPCCGKMHTVLPGPCLLNGWSLWAAAALPPAAHVLAKNLLGGLPAWVHELPGACDQEVRSVLRRARAWRGPYMALQPRGQG